MNFSLASMEGEQWKDIAQFDGYYCISNYGRIFAYPRPVYSTRGQFYHTREQMRKQFLHKAYNSYARDYTEQLAINLRYGSSNFSFKVNRLVYEYFVAPPGTDMDGLVVVHKDGDNCNNRYDNLELMNYTELYRHGLRLKRRPRTGLKRNRDTPSTSPTNASKRIIRYTLDGKKLQEYDSIQQAAKANNVNAGSIRKTAQQRSVQLYGFVYRFEGESYHGEHAGFSIRKAVTQYRPDGRKIKTFSSNREAGIKLGIDPDQISKCALGKAAAAGGFVWRYAGDRYRGEHKDRVGSRAKEIIQYSLDGKEIARYTSVNQASKETGWSPAVLLDSAHKRSKVAHGYVWRFAGDPYSGEYDGYRKGKPVTRYTREGKKIDTYPTIETAALATGLTPDNITKNVNGHNKTAGGFVWKFATTEEIERLPPERIKYPGGGKGKKVVQYSIEGKKLEVFASLSDAARACGSNVSNISDALDKPFRMAAGFVWRTVGNRYRGELSKAPPSNRARAVTQYDLKGRKVKVYPSIRQAGIESGVISSVISAVVRGKLKTTGGFIWISGDGPATIDTEAYFASITERIRKSSKPVQKYSLEGELLKEYPSIKEAARQEGISGNRISSVINGKANSAGGDYWVLKEDS